MLLVSSGLWQRLRYQDELVNKKLKDKIITLTHDLKHLPDGRNRHFTFIVKRNRILSIGWNSTKTHPRANKYKYRFDAIHSELSAVLKFKGNLSDLRDCVLINSRINSLGIIGYAKPCKFCLDWLGNLNFRKIYYSSHEGKIVKL